MKPTTPTMMRVQVCTIGALLAISVASIALTPAITYAQNLKSTQFEDGTGSIGLGPGYHITEAYHGTVTAVNSNGCGVILGMPWVILRPDSSVASLPAAANSPQGMPGDLVGALRQVLVKTGHAQIKSIRQRSAPSAIPGVPAVYFKYDFVQGGKSMTGLGYFTCLNPGGDSPNWRLYSSAVVAPTATFTKNLPTMMAMWRSWRPNGQAPLAGSSSAVIDEVLKNRQQSMDKINEQFRETL